MNTGAQVRPLADMYNLWILCAPRTYCLSLSHQYEKPDMHLDILEIGYAQLRGNYQAFEVLIEGGSCLSININRPSTEPHYPNQASFGAFLPTCVAFFSHLHKMDPLLKILLEDEELDYDDDVIDYPDRLPEVNVCESETIIPETVFKAAKDIVYNERQHQLQRIAEEVARIQAMQEAEVERYHYNENRSTCSDSDDTDARSIFVNGVDYSVSKSRLEQHFLQCGPIVRLTILINNATGRSKGAAYVEFETVDAVQNALKLNSSVFCGRKLLVAPKRTNKPGFQSAKPSNYLDRRSSYSGYGSGYRKQHSRRYVP
uniref:RRM domain-containing protein n=1 Tax=Panagrellus redivivus TaxID=6233 RepID=A0A7E4VDQ3_PANRE